MSQKVTYNIIFFSFYATVSFEIENVSYIYIIKVNVQMWAKFNFNLL